MKSIGLRLWSGMMVLVIVMLVLLWLFQIVFLEKFYAEIRVGEVKNNGYTLIKDYEKNSDKDLNILFEDFAYNNSSSVEFIDLKGNTIISRGAAGTTGQMPMMMNNARVEAYKDAAMGKEVTMSLSHPRFGNTFMLIGLPVKISGEIQGVVLINMPMAPVNDTASILKKQFLYITIILLVTAILLSYLISRSFNKPILEITKVAEEMALGNFAVSSKTKNKDEIGRLAQTINYMGQELSKIEQLRKDLISNISHELRTPLSIIRGYAETIRDVSGNDERKREKQLEIIIDESERLSKIVDDILNLSQMQAGYFKLDLKRFPINKTLESVAKRYEVLSEKTGVEIVAQNAGEVMAEADEARIEQVLYNLINNAFNHTKAGGTIYLKTIDEGKAYKIEITDTGAGISVEELKHIWDRYYKSDKTSDRKNIGSGLGLAIVKNILEAHKFKYGVESKEGVGTTFWFEVYK